MSEFVERVRYIKTEVFMRFTVLRPQAEATVNLMPRCTHEPYRESQGMETRLLEPYSLAIPDEV